MCLKIGPMVVSVHIGVWLYMVWALQGCTCLAEQVCLVLVSLVISCLHGMDISVLAESVSVPCNRSISVVVCLCCRTGHHSGHFGGTVL